MSADLSPVDDYEPGDEFDWDREDDSQYCEHGTFIGSWWGPDLLCVQCEIGPGPSSLSPMFAVFYASAGCLPDSDLPEYVGTREQCERWMDEHADGYVRPDVEHDLYDLILVDLGEDATPEEVWARLSA